MMTMPQPNANIPSELAGEARELRALARRLVQNDDADDLTQDALVTALSQERKPRSLRPWLRQVLRNEYRASARQDSRRRRREESSWVPQPASAPDDEAHRADMVGAVNEALSELDEPYRVALQQRFFSELTAVDIARSEGCPAGTVRWRVQEGLRRVRRKLDERFDGRAQWVGGMMVIAGIQLPPPFPPSAQEGSTMTNTILMKVLAAAAIVAGGVTVAVVATQSDGDRSETAVGEAPATRADYHASMQTAAGGGAPAEAKQNEGEPLLLSRHERLGAGASASSGAADNGEPGAGAESGQGGVAVRAGATDCFADVALEPGEEVRVVLELQPSESDMHKVTGVRFNDARLNDIAGLSQCVAKVMADAVISELPKDIASIMVTVYANEAGKITDLQAPSVKGGGRERSVDADAPDPEAIARKLGLAPRGAADPLISIVECSDYDCKFCKRARATVDQIVADYDDKVAVYRLHNPLPFHKRADPAARAALAAGKQHKHWEMTDLLYDNLDKRSDEDFVALASELGLDTEQFKRDYASEATAATIEEHKRTCKGNGASGTPAFFINGDILVGAQPYEKFKAVIDDELAAAK